MKIDWNNLLFDLLGMIRVWASTMGIFILTALAQYLIDNQTWDWRQILIAAIVAGAKYLITNFDHTQAKQAVEKASVSGETPAPVVDTSKGETQNG